jgi:sulfoxide reductase heme-binding subunit YedZ
MGKVLSSRWTKAAAFLLCLVPLGLLGWRVLLLAQTGYEPHLTANPIEYITHFTGDWTIRFLLITLSITPLRKLLKQPKLVRYRRMLGIFAFAYLCLHFMTWFWFDKSFHWQEMWADILKRRFITVGMAGFLMLLPLAITSTAGWVRRLGFVNWQRLHRLIYFAALAGVIHYYWLVKSDVRLPLLYGAILGILMSYRAAMWLKPAPKRGVAHVQATTTQNTASLQD